MLKLVINNTKKENEFPTQFTQTKVSSNQNVLSDSFLFGVIETSKNIFHFRAQDSKHKLSIGLNLSLHQEVEDNGINSFYVATCDFPLLDLEKLRETLSWDEDLEGMISIKFLLKILTSLLLWCEEKCASFLKMTFDERNKDYIEVYQPFQVHEEEQIDQVGAKTLISVPTDADTYDNIIDYEERLESEFAQTLWREQSQNPTIRAYLKWSAAI